MFREHDGSRLWKHVKVLLLFWGTVEGFLSRADKSHLYFKKKWQAVPHGALVRARPREQDWAGG